MSEKVNRFDWAATLKGAAEVEDEDFRYALCARFLNRAIARIAASDSDEGFAPLAVRWFTRNRRDGDCATAARRLLRGVPSDTCAWAILEIVAGIDTEDASINPEHVGCACASIANDMALRDFSRAQTYAQRPGVPPDVLMPKRVASIAYHDEKRLQILDYMELRAVFALAKGEVK